MLGFNKGTSDGLTETVRTADITPNSRCWTPYQLLGAVNHCKGSSVVRAGLLTGIPICHGS